jgi:hypothetical protein
VKVERGTSHVDMDMDMDMDMDRKFPSLLSESW